TLRSAGSEPAVAGLEPSLRTGEISRPAVATASAATPPYRPPAGAHHPPLARTRPHPPGRRRRSPNYPLIPAKAGTQVFSLSEQAAFGARTAGAAAAGRPQQQKSLGRRFRGYEIRRSRLAPVPRCVCGCDRTPCKPMIELVNTSNPVRLSFLRAVLTDAG